MSTDEQGYSVSGQPIKVEAFVAEKYHRTDYPWETAAFLEALKDYEEQMKKEAKKK